MKKFVAGLLCGAAIMLSTSVLADGALKQITAYLTPDVSVELDGQKVALQNAPVNYDGSTYLPVRELAGVVGLSVEWDPNSRTAKLSSGKSPAIAEPGSTTKAEGAENSTKFENIPQIKKNGNLFIGLTAWQNKSGAKVTIDYQNRTITIERSGFITVVVNANDSEQYIIEDSVSYINSKLVE